jgi:hypothetical protein
VRSGPGAARTILLVHIISARPSKQPLMARTFLKGSSLYGAWLLFFVSARTKKRHHHRNVLEVITGAEIDLALDALSETLDLFEVESEEDGSRASLHREDRSGRDERR